MWFAERIRNHLGCICLIFLHCVLSNASSNCLRERMHNHTGCTCLTFVHFWSPSLEALHWPCFCLNHVFQDFDPSPLRNKCCLLCNSCFKLRKFNMTNLLWTGKTKIESENHLYYKYFVSLCWMQMGLGIASTAKLLHLFNPIWGGVRGLSDERRGMTTPLPFYQLPIALLTMVSSLYRSSQN